MWTEEQIKLLKTLWAAGVNTNEIGRQIKKGKHAVIGKARRLKLGEHPSHKKYVTNQEKKPAKKPASKNSPAVLEVVTEPQIDVPEVVLEATEKLFSTTENHITPTSRHLRLVELKEDVCKWPDGGLSARDSTFCGNDTSGKSPYCQYHAKLAFQPRSERRSFR